MNNGAFLTMSDVRFGYPRGAVFLGPCDLAVRVGTFHAVLGPNGVGKSTLLRLACGVLTPSGGVVTCEDRNLATIPELERARRIAFLPQRFDAPLDLSAREVVMLGRFPIRRNRFFDSLEDERAAGECMATTGVGDLGDRRLGDMSGGEAQRVHIAAALAQKPGLLVLDEPTSSLDPYHQMEIGGLLRKLCDEAGLTVLVATHDLNLAGQFADCVTLVVDGAVVCTGTPQETLTPDRLRSVYGVPFERFCKSSQGRSWVFPIPEEAMTVS